MNLPDAVVKQILDRSLGSDPDQIFQKLSDLSLIRQRSINRDFKIAEIKKKAEEEIKSLMAEEICLHEFTKTHGDPSGGSDSMIECLVCDKVLPKREYRRS